MDAPKQQSEDLVFKSEDIKINPHPEYFINVSEKISARQYFKNLFSGKRRVYALFTIASAMALASMVLIFLNHHNQRKPEEVSTESQNEVTESRKFINSIFNEAFSKVKTDISGKKDYREAFSYIDNTAASDDEMRDYLTLIKFDLYYSNKEYLNSVEVISEILKREDLTDSIKMELYSRCAMVYKHLDNNLAEEYSNRLAELIEKYDTNSQEK